MSFLMDRGELCCTSNATCRNQDTPLVERVRHGDVVRGRFAGGTSGGCQGGLRENVCGMEAAAFDEKLVFQREA